MTWRRIGNDALPFERVSPGHYIGRREDLTRDADVVEDEAGVRMSYKANTPTPGGSTFNLSFEDRLTLNSPGRVTVVSDVTYLFLSAARIAMTITAVTTP